MGGPSKRKHFHPSPPHEGVSMATDSNMPVGGIMKNLGFGFIYPHLTTEKKISFPGDSYKLSCHVAVMPFMFHLCFTCFEPLTRTEPFSLGH